MSTGLLKDLVQRVIRIQPTGSLTLSTATFVRERTIRNYALSQTHGSSWLIQ